MSEKWKNDGGHGGSDPGAKAKGIIEKEYTLEAALYVDKRLKEHGIDSGLTRDKDVTLEPNTRTAAVRASKAPFALSHHYNAGGGAGAEFIHSIFSDGKFEHMLADEFKKAGYPVRRVFCREGKNNKDYYYMHRETGYCRVTIVEYDFVDGPNAEKLKDKKYREGMYECVVRAVCRQEGVSYKPIVEFKAAAYKLDSIPTKSPQMVRLAKFYDTQNPDIIKKLKEEGYRIIELPE